MYFEDVSKFLCDFFTSSDYFLFPWLWILSHFSFNLLLVSSGFIQIWMPSHILNFTYYSFDSIILKIILLHQFLCYNNDLFLCFLEPWWVFLKQFWFLRPGICRHQLLHNWIVLCISSSYGSLKILNVSWHMISSANGKIKYFFFQLHNLAYCLSFQKF